VQAATPIHVLQELGGWTSVEMVRRYAHLSPAHLAEFAGTVERGDPVRLVSNLLHQGRGGAPKEA
jgi:hypothetical protein